MSCQTVDNDVLLMSQDLHSYIERARLLRYLHYLMKNEGVHEFNIGSGSGHSVKEVIAAVEDIIEDINQAIEKAQ